MIRSDRSKYVYRQADRDWRTWVMDEPGDIVIGVDHLDMKGGEDIWVNVVRCDESGHSSYHIHVMPNMTSTVNISAVSREDKLNEGLNAIRKLVEHGQVRYGTDSMLVSDIPVSVTEQVLQRQGKKGNTLHNMSITGTARISANLKATKLPSEEG